MKNAVLTLALLVCGATVAEAQVKNRWRLQWSNEKPQLYTYRTPDDRYQNFWYVVYTIENDAAMNGEEIVPLIFDILLYTETGKEYQNDFRKVDEAVIKENAERPRRAEALKYGRFYANVIDPEVEYKIIEKHARLGNRSDGIVRESIEALKKGFADAPPGSWGRPIGAIKARVLAGDWDGAAADARWALEAGAAEADSPIGRYAAALALLVLGDDEHYCNALDVVLSPYE